MRQSICMSLILATLLSGCGGASTMSRSPGTDTCPEPGTKVSFAKVKALPADFIDCDIETEVTYIAMGWSNQTCLNSPAEGKVQFQVAELGSTGTNTPMGSIGFMALVEKEEANSLFDAKKGDTLILRGGTHFAAYGGGLPGEGSACFIATTVAK